MLHLETQRNKWRENRTVLRLQNERERLNKMANQGRIPIEVASLRVRQINHEILGIYEGNTQCS